MVNPDHPKSQRDLWLSLAAHHLGRPLFDLRRPLNGDLREWMSESEGELFSELEQTDIAPLNGDWPNGDSRWVTPADVDWPAPDFPRGVLRVKGQFPRGFGVAIVGSRHADAYGVMMAAQVARDVVRAGGYVVSGGAFGIDIAAQKAAHECGGATVCVLGSGMSRPTPRTHLDHFVRLLDTGALVSPFPDGQPGARWTYLYRNPWIVALSRCVVVIQAGARSGALSTGRFALSHKVPVFCLDSSVEHPLHIGCRDLLARGAQPLTSETSWRAGVVGLDPQQSKSHVSDRERPPYGAEVWALFSNEPQSVATIHPKQGLEPRALFQLIARLELDGWLLRLPDLGYVAMCPGSKNVSESH